MICEQILENLPETHFGKFSEETLIWFLKEVLGGFLEKLMQYF